MCELAGPELLCDAARLWLSVLAAGLQKRAGRQGLDSSGPWQAPLLTQGHQSSPLAPVLVQGLWSSRGPCLQAVSAQRTLEDAALSCLSGA